MGWIELAKLVHVLSSFLGKENQIERMDQIGWRFFYHPCNKGQKRDIPQKGKKKKKKKNKRRISFYFYFYLLFMRKEKTLKKEEEEAWNANLGKKWKGMLVRE